MEDPKQDDVPKYMCQSGITQYELAKSIDAAMENAEQEVKSNHEQEALLIWCEQVLDFIQEEFLVQRELRTLASRSDFEGELTSLLPLCWAYYRSTADQHNQNGQGEFELIMTHLLERSFINALDILHARNIWRFDIQRSMQQTQTAMLKCVQRYVGQLGQGID